MRAEEPKVTAENLFVGGGEISAIAATHDWSQTPLGAVETWSDSLKTAAQILLAELDRAKLPEKPQHNSKLSPNCPSSDALPQAALADEFRVMLADALRPLTDATEIQATAARVLGESLGASRVIYVEVLPNGKEVIVHKNYTNGVAELSGLYHLEDFGRNLTDDHRAGLTAIVPDVASLKYTESEKAMYQEIDIAAHIDVPLIKNEQFVALLAVHQATPRQWTKDEVKQVEETAEQTWAAALRARAETALRKSEAKYRTLFESIDEGFCICEMLFDENGKATDYRFLEVNSVFGKLTGLEHAAGKTARELVPDLEAEWFEIYGRVVQTGEPARFEQQSVAMNRWFDVNVFGIGEAQSNQFAVLFTNITDRKRSEVALRQSEEQSRNILESITDAFFAVDENWRFTYVNQTACTLVNRTPGDLMGKIFWSEFPGVNNSKFEQMHRRVMRDRLSESVTEFYPDHNRWYEVRSYPAANGITMYFRNVTAQIQAESALRQTSAQLEQQLHKFNAVMSSVPDFIYIFDLSGRFIDVNKPLLDLWQKTLTEAIGKNFYELDYPVDLATKLQNQIQQVIQTRQPLKDETPYTSAFGTKAYEYIFVPIFDAEGAVEMVAGVTHDITQRKSAEAEREQLLQQEQAARAAAEQANQIKDEFLAVLSHELRSPLNPILGWARLLQTGKLDAAKQTDALKTIERNARLQLQLIEDLLDISRIMQGKLSLTAAPINLTFVVSSAIETVRLAAEAKNMAIALNFEPTIAPISGDAARLQQVVWNLLTNAVKFSPSGGQVTVELRQLDRMAQIRVIDTGKGIKAQFLPYVFEYFRQEDGSITRKFGGLGLGLAIVKQIVEMHGGTVKAESRGENQGATFIVQLPLMQQTTSVYSQPTCTQVNLGMPLANLQILLVDDDSDTREFQAFLLEQSGAKVTAVTSGLEALQVLENFVPDVLVSDVGMAQMDGYMLIGEIRDRLSERGKTILAIALTAYARDFDRQKALQAGFQAHLTKPVELEELVRTIVSLVRT